MSTYKELLAKKRELDGMIEAARRTEREAVITSLRELMALYDINVGDLQAKHGPKPTGPLSPKYRDPLSGATWSGRGRVPHWIAGKDRAAFAI